MRQLFTSTASPVFIARACPQQGSTNQPQVFPSLRAAARVLRRMGVPVWRVDKPHGPMTCDDTWWIGYLDGQPIEYEEWQVLRALLRGQSVPSVAPGAPVPGTGRPGHRMRYLWKYPRTTGALRAACGVERDEDEPDFRYSRRNLPTVWDDRVRGRERGWKAHRRTQWR